MGPPLARRICFRLLRLLNPSIRRFAWSRYRSVSVPSATHQTGLAGLTIRIYVRVWICHGESSGDRPAVARHRTTSDHGSLTASIRESTRQRHALDWSAVSGIGLNLRLPAGALLRLTDETRLEGRRDSAWKCRMRWLNASRGSIADLRPTNAPSISDDVFARDH